MDLNEWTRGARLAQVVFGLTVTFGVATAQERSPNELVKALQSGGYVLVMRHASSPREAPSKEVANADNTKLERQLDEAGRKGATMMGEVTRALRIPIGLVLTSRTGKGGITARSNQDPRLVTDAPTTLIDSGESGRLRRQGTRSVSLVPQAPVPAT